MSKRAYKAKKEGKSVRITPNDGTDSFLLSEKQYLFVKAYLVDFHITNSAIDAGYSKKTAAFTGSENLKKHKIQRFIALESRDKEDRLSKQEEELEEKCELIELNQESIIKGLLRVANMALGNIDTPSVVTGPDGEVLIDAKSREANLPVAKSTLELLGKHRDMQLFIEKRENTNETVINGAYELIKPSTGLPELTDAGFDDD